MDLAGLLGVLDDIRQQVASGNSPVGTITWGLPEQVGADPYSYDVTATYRRESPGGIRVIGH
jgi:hypothetical protein